MEKEKLNNQSKPPKYSFTTISDYFLDKWSGVVGVGPTSLYIHLLKYCYKKKNLAWPTLKTLSKKMGVSERTLIRYRKTEDDGNDPGKARLYRANIGGSGNNDKKFLSSEEIIKRFHLLGQKLKAMNYSQSKP